MSNRPPPFADTGWHWHPMALPIFAHQHSLKQLKILLIFCWSFTALLQCSSVAAEENLTTVLVCEGGLASLHCPPQHEIAVHLANFGRFSLQTCNPTMRLDINTQCHNPHTINVLRASCDHHQQCNVQASTEVFGDTCQGNIKYLEASFKCVASKATTTTSTTTTTLSTSSAAASSATTTVAVPSDPIVDGGGEIPDEEEKDGNDEETANGQLNGKNSQPPTGCPSVLARNLHWPPTEFGETAKMPCPQGGRGHAEWHCSTQEGKWTPEDGPNLSRCISDWARELREDLEEFGGGGETSAEERRNLLEMLREGHEHVRKEQLMGGDALMMGEMLAETAEKLARKKAMEEAKNGGIIVMMTSREEERHKRQEQTLEFVRLIIDTAGHLLRPNQRPAWLDIPSTQRQLLANQLVQTMPQTLALLLPLPNWPKAGSESLLAEPTLVAEVAQASIYDYVPFPSMSLYRQNFDTALLPREALQFYGQDLANVFYTAWDPSLANHLLGINPDEANVKRRRKKIITKLIGISIVPLNGRMVHSRHIQRPVGGRPIVLTFQNMEKQGGGQIDRPICVWWDVETKRYIEEKPNANDWSEEDWEGAEEGNEEEGCHLREANGTHIVCECHRMVNGHFAVMANINANDGQAVKKSALLLLGLFLLVSLLLAIICLFISLLIGTILWRRPTPTKGEQIQGAFNNGTIVKGTIQKRSPFTAGRHHFCALLLLLEAILMIRLVGPKEFMFSSCQWLAFSRDYLILAILCWTFLDAFQLWRSSRHPSIPVSFANAVKNSQKRRSSNCLCCCCWPCSMFTLFGPIPFGYGIPLLLLALMAFASSTNQSAEICWPSVDLQHLLLPLFIGPVCILLISAICCLLAIFWTIHRANSKCQNKNIPATASGTKFFSSTAYHPCATNSTILSGSNNDAVNANGTKATLSAAALRHQQKMERRIMGEMRGRSKWLCARMALLAAAASSALLWASMMVGEEENEGGRGGDVGMMIGIGLIAMLANAGLGILLLCETMAINGIGTSYRHWRLGNGGKHGKPVGILLRLLDFLCCFPAPTENGQIAKKLARTDSNEFPQIKFPISGTHSHSNANSNTPSSNNSNTSGGAGNFTPNSTSTSSSSSGPNGQIGNGNNGGGGGRRAMSAAAYGSDHSTTAEIQFSSTASSNNSNGNGNDTPHPPTPAPLLQLYQEAKMQQQLMKKNSNGSSNNFLNSSQSQTQQEQQQNCQMNCQSPPFDEGHGNANGEGSIYEYATIPYEDLLTAFHRQMPQQQQQQQQYHQMPMPARNISNNGCGGGIMHYGGAGGMPSSFVANQFPPYCSPRLVHPNGNNYGTGSPYSPSPLPIRLGLIGQQQVSHHQYPANGIGTGYGDMFMPMGHYGAGCAQPHPPMMEMGIHSAPPNFPPPPPPAPSAVDPSAVGQFQHGPMSTEPVHFRRSSSGSLRSGGGTLVLRMDLSRPQPLISERIDSADVLDEAEEEAQMEEKQRQEEDNQFPQRHNWPRTFTDGE